MNGIHELFGKHEIVDDSELVDGYTLHRFVNTCGVPYSAIYNGKYEIYSAPREREEAMVKYFNEFILGVEND